MADLRFEPPLRRIEGNFNKGWGVAAFIIALATACVLGAFYLHSTTYVHPTDVRSHAVGSGAAPAEH